MTLPTEIQHQRSKGIGGSEVAAILGMDKYNSPYKVWLTKTGREQPEPENKFMRAGIILESAIADFFQKETNYRVFKSSAKSVLYTHPKHKFAIGIPDRFYQARKKIGRGTLECKNTQMQLDEIIDSWFCQLQWYLGVTGTMYGAIAWLERGVDFKYKEYEFNSEFFDWMIERVGKFWNENVLKQIEPAPICVEDIQMIYEHSAAGKTIEATEELVAAHKKISTIKSAIKELEKESAQLEEAVKLSMLDAEIIAENGNPLFTWKSSKPIQSFDKSTFKKDNPELYSKYQIEKPGIRRFLIK